MHKRLAIVCLGSLCLSACAAGAGGVSNGARTASSAGTVPAPRILRENGLESVIGKQATALTQRFGEARIDLSEGDARKLQFISETCVLDIFLYPLAPRSQPVATHVEARQRVGGGNANRAGCIADVERTARKRG